MKKLKCLFGFHSWGKISDALSLEHRICKHCERVQHRYNITSEWFNGFSKNEMNRINQMIEENNSVPNENPKTRIAKDLTGEKF